MAKKRKKRAYKVWSKTELQDLKKHSREMTPVRQITRLLKRTEATIRMKAYSMGLSLGHRKRQKKTKARA